MYVYWRNGRSSVESKINNDKIHPGKPHHLKEEHGRLACEQCPRFVSLSGPQSLQRIFAKGECLLSSAARAVEAAERSGRSRGGGRAYGAAHALLQTGALTWCRVCGAYSEKRIQQLLGTCTGPAGKGPRQSQLARLLRGRHPASNEVIGAATVPAQH